MHQIIFGSQINYIIFVMSSLWPNFDQPQSPKNFAFSILHQKVGLDIENLG